ncbi:hypothetical protein HYH03_011019 [Edaphochlamys debaryana]|uniref:60S ribosomal protein L35 n=1 Tax=Edaphochlamys debaryana TaxID=47281 RepID=A0A835XX48_9CHLO|nr:hypothetical protein HYH03_011019 [Edaphochlamys debaryana]|eukprot:KAG2490628.1 hypothetical protein HYH03_011019 [Edaphochlamys debaryana]
MTKIRRRIIVRPAPEEFDEDEDNEASDAKPVLNTAFLGRLVIGNTTGNQRKIETDTAGAANKSIGATGAASLRLQMQRAASARTAKLASVRRVVLSVATQQRLTLCSSLLAEVAAGFGFRVTVRRPDGQEMTARQAMDAAAALERKGARVASTGAAGGAEPADVDNGAGAGDGADGAAEAGDAAARAPAPADPLDALEPLEVDLDVGTDSPELALAVLQSGITTRRLSAPVAPSLARRLATSPTGARPVRPTLNSLLSGRLTSAALGSVGLVGPKKTAAAQAVQAAKRRVLARAASNAGGEEAAAAAAAAAGGAGPSTAEGAEADADAAVPADAGAPASSTGAAASGGGAEPGPGGAAGGRRIVWNPEAIKSPTPPPSAAPAAGAGGAGGAAKRARIAAASEVPAEAAAAGRSEGDSEDGDTEAGADAGHAEEAAGAGNSGAGAAEEVEAEDAGPPAKRRAPASAAAAPSGPSKPALRPNLASRLLGAAVGAALGNAGAGRVRKNPATAGAGASGAAAAAAAAASDAASSGAAARRKAAAPPPPAPTAAEEELDDGDEEPAADEEMGEEEEPEPRSAEANRATGAAAEAGPGEGGANGGSSTAGAVQGGGAGAARSRPSSAPAGGRATPASKLFGAAMRHIQPRGAQGFPFLGDLAPHSSTDFTKMAKVKVHELRSLSKQDLISKLKELKGELSALRVAKVTGGAPNKLSKIKVVRKSIARVLTVYKQSQRTAVKNKITEENEKKKGRKFLPLDMRAKKTRAIRRRLTKEQSEKKLAKVEKKAKAFPTRKFALKA